MRRAAIASANASPLVAALYGRRLLVRGERLTLELGDARLPERSSALRVREMTAGAR